MKIVSILFLLTFLQGCTGKYFYREVSDGMGGTTEVLFAYGKFCGGNHPANLGEVDENGNVRTLLSMYPPVDDLDAMCYAHDYCFRLSEADHIVCDMTLQWMTGIYEYKFPSLGCWDVLSSISMAMAAKNYEKGSSVFETWANRITNTAVGIPLALIGTAIYTPLKLIASDAKEGECNIGKSSDPVKIIRSFERIYKRSPYNILKRRSISIPIPETTHEKYDS